jgi:hypothetical protein
MPNWDSALTDAHFSDSWPTPRSYRKTIVNALKRMHILIFIYGVMFTVVVIATYSHHRDLSGDETRQLGGQANLASFEQGARIIPRYTSRPKQGFFRSLLPFRKTHHPPAIVLSDEMIRDRCWSFHRRTTLGIRLSHSAILHAIEIEHIVGDAARAPMQFHIWGVTSIDALPLPERSTTSQQLANISTVLLGSFVYDRNSENLAQNFTVQKISTVIEEVVIEMDNDEGLGCLYKVRVYGEDV